MEQKTKVHAENGTQQLVVTRDFDLSVGLLFKAHTEHELFEHDRFLMQMSVGTMPHASIMRSIELYATVVAPAVRAALRPVAAN